MKSLSSDTTMEAQRFLIERLRAMPLAKKYAITAGTIRAGFALHRSEVKDMNPFEVARQVTEFLEKEDIEYFVGGSLASTTYGEPRFTQDIDLIVRLSILFTFANGPKSSTFPISWSGLSRMLGSKDHAESKVQFDITPSLSYDASIHRTTINLDEGIYLRVKAMAQRNGKSLARTIEDLLRTALGSGEQKDATVPLHEGNGPLPGVDIADRERLYDFMEGR